MVHCVPQLRKEANHFRDRDHCSTPDPARAFGDSAATTDPGRIADPTRIADSRRIADPGGVTPNGDNPMITSSVVRNRFPGSVAAVGEDFPAFPNARRLSNRTHCDEP